MLVKLAAVRHQDLLEVAEDRCEEHVLLRLGHLIGFKHWYAGQSQYRIGMVGTALLNNLAAACIERGDYDQARAAAEKGIAVAPELPQLRRTLATALEGMAAERREQNAQSANRS